MNFANRKWLKNNYCQRNHRKNFADSEEKTAVPLRIKQKENQSLDMHRNSTRALQGNRAETTSKNNFR